MSYRDQVFDAGQRLRADFPRQLLRVPRRPDPRDLAQQRRRVPAGRRVQRLPCRHIVPNYTANGDCAYINGYSDGEQQRAWLERERDRASSVGRYRLDHRLHAPGGDVLRATSAWSPTWASSRNCAAVPTVALTSVAGLKNATSTSSPLSRGARATPADPVAHRKGNDPSPDGHLDGGPITHDHRRRRALPAAPVSRLRRTPRVRCPGLRPSAPGSREAQHPSITTTEPAPWSAQGPGDALRVRLVRLRAAPGRTEPNVDHRHHFGAELRPDYTERDRFVMRKALRHDHRFDRLAAASGGTLAPARTRSRSLSPGADAPA